MSIETCPIEGCSRPRGLGGKRRLCESHYFRLRRYGDPLGSAAPRERASKRERWEKFVNRTESCWLWTGSTNGQGYGQLRSGGKVGYLEKAHRLGWEFYRGPIPDGMLVLHRCDNPPCVNPDHLFLGSVQDNVDDRRSKGRTVRLPGDLRKTVPTKANGRWRPKGSRKT